MTDGEENALIARRASVKKFIENETRYFVQWYKTVVSEAQKDGIVFQVEEIDAISWVSPEELRGQLERNSEKFVSSMRELVDWAL